ncbi:hypothetical protein FOL47_007655 [Perkinsus chesapeaki]|uniref:Uncharacterized protein n=1 Tax=Perkinsus chesapeaki TaxID=330153 RepID=A0A7J6MW11_PERCH|nr:hypothetical protein FOL47_007655 [Perkinsus chesapeaki]
MNGNIPDRIVGMSRLPEASTVFEPSRGAEEPASEVRLYRGDGRISRLMSFIEATHSAASTVTAVVSLSGATTQGFLLYSIHPALQWTLSMAEVGVIATAGTSVLTIIRECSGELPLVWDACMRVGSFLSPWSSLASSALLIYTVSPSLAPYYATVMAFNTGGLAFAEWARVVLRKSTDGLTRTLGTAGAWFGAISGAAFSVVLSVSVAAINTGPLSLVLYSGLCHLGWGQPTIGLAITGGMSAAGALCGGAVGVAAGSLHRYRCSTDDDEMFWRDWLTCMEHVPSPSPRTECRSFDPEIGVWWQRANDVLFELAGFAEG